jgi:hypothetical protein
MLFRCAQDAPSTPRETHSKACRRASKTSGGPVITTVPELISLIAAHHATAEALACPGDRVVVTPSPAQVAVVFLERAGGPVLADRGHPDDVAGADLDRPAAGILHSAERVQVE